MLIRPLEPAASYNHGMTASIYYKDLDGNGIEIIIDLFSDELAFKVFSEFERWNEYFQSHLEGIHVDWVCLMFE